MNILDNCVLAILKKYKINSILQKSYLLFCSFCKFFYMSFSELKYNFYFIGTIFLNECFRRMYADLLLKELYVPILFHVHSYGFLNKKISVSFSVFFYLLI